MHSRINRRLVALAFMVAGAALLQGCAVTTGRYVPNRSVNTNNSMVSHYDVLRQQSAPTSSFKIVSSRNGGVFDYRYY